MEILTMNEGDRFAIYEARDIDERLQRLEKQVIAVGDYLLKNCENEEIKVLVHDKLSEMEDKMSELMCECLSYGLNKKAPQQ